MKIKLHKKTSTFSMLEIDEIIIYFSYENPIAICKNGKQTVIENWWGSTTGRHINTIQHDKKLRVSKEVFNKKLEAIFKKHKF